MPRRPHGYALAVNLLCKLLGHRWGKAEIAVPESWRLTFRATCTRCGAEKLHRKPVA